MNNEVKFFDNEEFGKIRTVEVKGKLFFVASDIAKALGYMRPADAVNQHCRYTVKHRIPHPQNPEKTLEVNIIPEGDMYRLITASELPSAQEFEAWVFDEVLPALRKTGTYNTDTIYQYNLTAAVGTAVAELARVTERIMIAQGSTPHEIAEVFALECQQFGIQLPANFVKIPAYEQLVLHGIN